MRRCAKAESQVELLSRHPEHSWSSLVQLYYTGSPGTPSPYPLFLNFVQLQQLQSLTKVTRSLVTLSTAISYNIDIGGKAKLRPGSYAGCLPASGWFLGWTGWSQQGGPQGRGVLKPQRKAGGKAPFWPRQSCRRPKIMDMDRFVTRQHPHQVGPL